MASNTSLQNINWLPASKNVCIYPVYIKERMSIVPVYEPFPCTVFSYFLEGQVQPKEVIVESLS